jgi:hypothetical protein
VSFVQVKTVDGSYITVHSSQLPSGNQMSLGDPPAENLTFGKRAVGYTFNPSGDDAVLGLKAAAAFFIDLCHQAREESLDPEIKRMYSVAITEAQTAQMWSVKAATWRG